MEIRIHPHALERMTERGIFQSEIIDTVKNGESYPVKLNRMGFRKNFPYQKIWNGKYFSTKQVEVICIFEGENCIVITSIAKYF
jgi:hypothetical protein